MSRGRSEAPHPPPGPARDLADLYRWLRGSCVLSIGQIASRSGYSPSHISEVLNGRKAPSPDAAATIAQVLGADGNAVIRARRYAEEWQRLRRHSTKDWGRDGPQQQRSSPSPDKQVMQVVEDRPGCDLKPDPNNVRTTAELLKVMNDFRIWAGEVSFRVMAEQSGKIVSSSTLHRALTGTTLPPQKVVIAVISGCGGSEDDEKRFASAWRMVRTRRARALQAVESPPTEQVS